MAWQEGFTRTQGQGQQHRAMRSGLTVVSDAIARTDEARRNRPDWNLERIERQTIQAALQAHDGNLSHAAAELGLTRQTLYRRLAKHELEG